MSLIKAAKSGSLSKVRHFLDKGSDPNKCDVKWTPLYAAAWNGNVDVVNELIKRGADVDISNIKGWTPAHVAAQRGNVDALKILISHQANSNTLIKGYTLLDAAIAGGKKEAIELLLNEGASNLNNEKEWVNMVVKKPDLLECALKHKPEILNYREHYTNKNILHMATILNNVSLVKRLMELGMNINVPKTGNETVLHMACVRGHLDLVKLFLDEGMDVNLENNTYVTPFFYAVISKNAKLVKYLCEKGVNIDKHAHGKSPLMEAVISKDIETMNVLIDMGAKLGYEHMRYVIPYDSIEILEILLKSSHVNAEMVLDMMEYAEETNSKESYNMLHRFSRRKRVKSAMSMR
jgi:ankyrin repeat protein